MSRWVFLIWAIAGSLWDIKSKKVPVWWINMGVAAAVLWFCVRDIPPVWRQEITAGTAMFEVLQNVLPGIFLLLVSYLGKGAVGAADGWFLIVLGLLRGYPEACGSLFGGIMAAGLVAGVGLWKRKLKRDSRLPLLPYLTIAWLVIQISRILL